jgi:hypothetical protein
MTRIIIAVLDSGQRILSKINNLCCSVRTCILRKNNQLIERTDCLRAEEERFMVAKELHTESDFNSDLIVNSREFEYLLNIHTYPNYVPQLVRP